jgi:hypothetical protein
MKRAPSLLLLLVCGCSTAPVADVMDYLVPGRIDLSKGNPYGGVCIPQGGPPGGAVAPLAVPVVPVAPPPGAVPAAPVVPPPPPPAGVGPVPFPGPR